MSQPPPRPPNNRNTPHYSRHVPQNQHLGRNSQARWPVTVTHVPFSKDYRQIYSPSDKESSFDNYGKPGTIPNTSVANPNLFISVDGSNDIRELRQRQLTPPLPFAVRTAQGQENSLSLRAASLQNLNNHSGILGNPLEINQYSASLSMRSSAALVNFGSHSLSELRMSPIHIQNPSNYFHSSQQEEGSKSESPSRKRRRLSHHMADSPPPPPPRWEPRRSQRQQMVHHHHHHHHNHTTRRINGCKMRYNGYGNHVWDRPEQPYPISPPPHRSNAFLPLHPSPAVSPLQQSLMVDVSQVPLTVPVSIYTGTPISVCQGGTVSSSPVHNVYSNPPIHCSIPPQQYAGCISQHHQHHVQPHAPPAYLSPPSQASLHFSPPPRADHTLLHMSPSPPIFISDNPFGGRAAPLDINPRSRQGMVNNLIRPTNRRWRYHSFAGPQYPNILQLLAMIATPLSPELGSSESEMENYEALLHVAERLSEERPRGLNRVEINQIPSFKFDLEKHHSDQTTCVVCMCDFEEQQTLRELPCSHMFHARCVDKWLKTNRTCPICRGDTSGDPSLSE